MTQPEVKKAEEEVRRSNEEFERAMEHLEHSVENTARKVVNKIESVQETIHKPKKIAQNMVNRAEEMLHKGRDFMVNSVERTRVTYRRIYERFVGFMESFYFDLRRRPGLRWSLIACTACGALIGYALGRKRAAGALEGGRRREERLFRPDWTDVPSSGYSNIDEEPYLFVEKSRVI